MAATSGLLKMLDTSSLSEMEVTSSLSNMAGDSDGETLSDYLFTRFFLSIMEEQQALSGALSTFRPANQQVAYNYLMLTFDYAIVRPPLLLALYAFDFDLLSILGIEELPDIAVENL